jgi:hypothetical protein
MARKRRIFSNRIQPFLKSKVESRKSKVGAHGVRPTHDVRPRSISNRPMGKSIKN